MEYISPLLSIEELTLDNTKNIAIIVSGTIAALTLVFGYFQFRQSVRQHRADQFSAMRLRREQSDTINKIAHLLEEDDPKLSQIPWEEKLKILAFYEDVALEPV